MKAACIIALALVAPVAGRMRLQSAAEPVSDFDLSCFEESDKGESYRGLLTSTESGRTCQVWVKSKPHEVGIEPSPTNGLGNHNYCRNPDGSEDKPWCFTMDPSPDHKKETCTVPICKGMDRDFKDEAKTIATKVAPSFDCDCLAVLHALSAGGALLQKTNITQAQAVSKGNVVNGRCICKK